MNTIKDLTGKGGNFAFVVNGTLKEEKLSELLVAGVTFESERGALSKAFKGIKKRNSVPFSEDSAAMIQGKLVEHLKTFFADDLAVVVSKREWSAGAGKEAAAAQAVYDELIGLGVDKEKAEKAAKKAYAKWEAPTVAKVEEKPQEDNEDGDEDEGAEG